MKIISTQQTKDVDRYTIEQEPISSIDLMERASIVFVKEFTKTYVLEEGYKIIVLAGNGNNGGDALAIARWLADYHYPVEVVLYNPKRKLSPDCALNLARLQPMSIPFTEDVDFSSFPELTNLHIVIDGLFGSGLNAHLSEGYERLISHINRSEAHVVAIDIPSGLFGEDNASNLGSIVKASRTFTFQSPKLSFLLAENEAFVGEWKTLDIGLHPQALAETESPYFMTTPEEIKILLKNRSRFSHKGTFGHALLWAGSDGKMGAAVLAAKACLRTGAGLLTCYIPECGINILQTTVPEAMVCTELPETAFTAIGIGPGVGITSESIAAFSSLLEKNEKPMVLDADALNILSTHPSLSGKVYPESILTPHPKEFDRLAGVSHSSFERLQKAMRMAEDRCVFIVLKGAYTAVCCPDGNCYFNPTGNPGMATAGSGDVLTGIILSLLCQGYSPKDSARIGVFLHGMAGDEIVASKLQSEESLLAGDIPEMIGRCFCKLRSSR